MFSAFKKLVKYTLADTGEQDFMFRKLTTL